jgi:hypothetical protein
MAKKRSEDVEVRLQKLYPRQAEILAHPARFKTAMLGRRTGKTVLGMRWLCDGALAGEPVAWFAPGYKYAAEVWREFVSRLGPIVKTKNEQEKRLELVTGGVLDLWTLDGEDPARGRKYKRVVVDEAGIVMDLMLKWQESIRPTLTDLAGEAMFLGTPKGRRHGFVQLFNRGLDGNDPSWQSFRFATSENPYIPPEEIDAARRELPLEVFRQEYEAIPTDDGANPFGLDAVRATIAPLSRQAPVVYGLDVARAMDFTVLIGLDAWGRTCYLERWQMPWAVTKERVKAVVGDVPVVGDATGVGDAIMADLQLAGLNITPFIFSQPSKLRLMQRLVAAFQSKSIRIPDGWLVAELESFEFNYTASGVKYEAPSGHHDDGVMALGLALHGWDRVQGVAPTDVLESDPDADDPHVRIWQTPGAPLQEMTSVGSFLSQLPQDGF